MVAHIPPPKPKEEEKSTGEYVPTEQEKAELLPYFYQLNPLEQHKDLLITKNVIKKKPDIDKWKHNPKYYDVRGIDTQPEGLISERLKIVTTFTGNPEIQTKKFNWVRQRGRYRYTPQMVSHKGSIRVDSITKSKGTFNRVLSHELGHAYDRNIISMMTSDTHRLYRHTGNVGFGNIKKPKVLQNLSSFSDNRSASRKADSLMLELSDIREKNRKKVIAVTERRISPYNTKTAPFKYITYRRRNAELFADWFSGFVTSKPIIKRQSRGFYNTFRKSNKPLFKALRQSDFEVTRKYMGGLNAKKFRLF